MPNTIPNTLHDLLQVFEQVAKYAGAKVHGTGHGYSNGPYEDMEVELPNGFRVWVCLEESSDEDYLINRYPEDYA